MRRPDIIAAVLTAVHTLMVCQGRSNAGGWLLLVKGDSQVEALWHTATLDRKEGKWGLKVPYHQILIVQSIHQVGRSPEVTEGYEEGWWAGTPESCKFIYRPKTAEGSV